MEKHLVDGGSPQSPFVFELASGQLALTSSGLNFGSIQVGTSSTLSTAVSNTSKSNIIISQASVTGTGFSFSGPGLPITVAACGNFPGDDRNTDELHHLKRDRFAGFGNGYRFRRERLADAIKFGSRTESGV